MQRNGVMKDHRLMPSNEIMIIGNRNVVNNLLPFERFYALYRVHKNPLERTCKVVKPPSEAILCISSEDELLEFLETESLATSNIVLHDLGLEASPEEVGIDWHQVSCLARPLL